MNSLLTVLIFVLAATSTHAAMRISDAYTLSPKRGASLGGTIVVGAMDSFAKDHSMDEVIILLAHAKLFKKHSGALAKDEKTCKAVEAEIRVTAKVLAALELFTFEPTERLRLRYNDPLLRDQEKLRRIVSDYHERLVRWVASVSPLASPLAITKVR